MVRFIKLLPGIIGLKPVISAIQLRRLKMKKNRTQSIGIFQIIVFIYTVNVIAYLKKAGRGAIFCKVFGVVILSINKV